jgi:uncharacterized membrane protein YdjX (TVP38/TMEM64 family)
LDNETHSQDPVGWKPVIKVVLLVLVMVLCVVLMKAFKVDQYFRDSDWRDEFRQKMGHWLPLAYVVLGTIVIAVGAPRIWYSFLGGGLFGFAMGSVWGHLATMTGSMACFWFAQSLGREWVQHKFGRRFGRIEKRLHDEGFSIMLLVRLCPIGNNFITNCLAGASAMRALPFFLASLIGHLPLTIFFALLGSGIVKSEKSQTLIAPIGLVVFVLAFVVYFRKSKVGRQIARELSGRNGAEK